MTNNNDIDMLNVYYRPIQVKEDYSWRDETADVIEMYSKKDIDNIIKNFIPLSSLEKFIEDNEEKDCKCGVFCDCNLEARDAHNSVLKLLKDKFIHNEQ